MDSNLTVNNDIYDTLGERWYEANDDPVALLRAETRTTGPWIVQKLSEYFDKSKTCEVLDVGCGGGFLSNRLAAAGYSVVGIDLSPESLKVAERHDHTGTVRYQVADAYKLPFPDASFDVVTSMDFLEHVEDPARAIAEASRVLRPGGLFFFHTFNRNPVAGLVIIKFVEWFVKNTPKHMHILRLFIKPSEMESYCNKAQLTVKTMIGTRPNVEKINLFKALATRTVPPDFSFSFTNSLLLAYLGFAEKKKEM